LIQRYSQGRLYETLPGFELGDNPQGSMVMFTDHIAEMKRVKDALREAERLLTELYPSDIHSDAHEAEYYAVNVVINKAQAILAEED